MLDYSFVNGAAQFFDYSNGNHDGSRKSLRLFEAFVVGWLCWGQTLALLGSDPAWLCWGQTLFSGIQQIVDFLQVGLEALRISQSVLSPANQVAHTIRMR